MVPDKDQIRKTRFCNCKKKRVLLILLRSLKIKTPLQEKKRRRKIYKTRNQRMTSEVT